MAANPNDVFQTTMAQLETGLQARHIWTTPVTTSEADELATDVVNRLQEFDQIPVRENGPIIGVLMAKAAQTGKTAKACMTALHERMLVGADEPLVPLLHDLLEEPYYRLVVEGTGIRGIVTRSDVLKLPVRVMAFTLVAHVESLLTVLISECAGDNATVLGQLDEETRKTVNEELGKYAKRRADPPVVELLTLFVKVELAGRLLGLSACEISELHTLRRLRNDVDHLRDYAFDLVKLAEFRSRVELAQGWISRLKVMSDGRRQPPAPVEGLSQ